MSNDKLRPETTYQSVIGRIIVKIRKELGVEQLAVAQAVGVTQSTWSRIERGESSLTVEQLVNAATCLRINPSSVFLEAEDAVRVLKKQGVLVSNEKPKLDKSKVGMALIGASALGLLVAAAVAKSKGSDDD